MERKHLNLFSIPIPLNHLSNLCNNQKCTPYQNMPLLFRYLSFANERKLSNEQFVCINSVERGDELHTNHHCMPILQS